MPRYHVYGHVVGTKYLGEFEAKNEKAAEGIALNGEEAYSSLCHQCSSECSDPEIKEATAELVEQEGSE